MKRLILVIILLITGCAQKYEATSGIVKLSCLESGDSSPTTITLDLDNRAANWYLFDTRLSVLATSWSFTFNTTTSISIVEQRQVWNISRKDGSFSQYTLMAFAGDTKSTDTVYGKCT